MKKLIAFILASIFIFTLGSINNQLTGTATKPGFMQTITITTSGTTNELGCNPTAAAIQAALGSAQVSTDCPPGDLAISDGQVIISGCNYSQTRTWTASDACGGTATASRTVNWIVKEQAPFVSISFTTNDPGCNPSAAVIEGALGIATITNSCGNVVLTVTTGAVQISGCNRTQTRSWTATDDCANFASATRTINWMEDLVPPTIIANGTNTNLGCNPSTTMIAQALGTAIATDNCGSVSLVQSDGPINSSGCNRSQTRSWTVSDDCGNSFIAGRTATWTEDVTAPVFNPVTNITQSPDPGMSSAVVTIVTPTVTDNCGGGQISGVRSDNLPLNDPYPLGQTTITWTATDACGNFSSVNQTITIGDTQMPVINYCPVIPAQCFTENSIYTIPVLTASDNWGIQSISYLITGVTSREGDGNNASGLFNPGTSMINWTVTDLAGNTATCATNVVVDKVDVAIPDAYAANITSAIGSPNTIYIGYGGSSITLTANVTSSVAPNSFSYKWTTGSPGGPKVGTGPTITVNPSASTTYFVSVKDENNCTPLAQISKLVTVTDIRCGNGKVWVCEMQKNGTVKSVCLPTTKIPDLSPGSYLGQCTEALITSAKTGETTGLTNDLSIMASPNPSNGSFDLRILPINNQHPILIRTIDITGRVIDIKGIFPGQILRVGNQYKPGMYIIEALQGDRRAVIKVLKIGN